MNRTKRINIRLTPAEHAAISKNAKASGMKVTEYVRKTLMDPAMAYRAVKTQLELLKLEVLNREMLKGEK